MSDDQTYHDKLPSGFGWATPDQAEAFNATGSVNGASKVALVRQEGGTVDLAIRMRPPRSYDDIDRELIGIDVQRHGITEGAEAVAWYTREYNAGFKAGKRSTEMPADKSHSWDDGYLDAAAGRLKWHLTYCADHDTCGEG